MSHALLLLTAALLLQAPAPNAVGVAPADTAAITQTLLDYAEGYYGGEPARMTRALSPYLTKRELRPRPGARPLLGEMNADTLIEGSNGAKLAAEGRRITTEVFDAGAETASARVFTAQFNDYVHLIKRDGAWRIVNVLWHAPPAGIAQDSRAAVEEVVRAYAGALTGAAGDTAALLHPLAHLRTLAPGRQGRPRIIVDQNADAQLAALARGAGRLPGTGADSTVIVEGIDADIASARFRIGATTMYLHLASEEGRWRVVNALRYAAVFAPAPGE